MDKIDESTKQEYMKMGNKLLYPQRLSDWNLFLDCKDYSIVIGTMISIKKLENKDEPDIIKFEYDNMYGNRDEIVKAVLKFSKRGPEFCEIVGNTAGKSLEELEDKKMENAILEEMNSERFAADSKKEEATWIDSFSLRDLDEALAVLQSYDERGESAFIDFNGKLLYSSDRLTYEKASKLRPDMVIVEERKQALKEGTHSIEDVKEGVSVQRAGSVNETMQQAVIEGEKEIEQDEKDEQDEQAL